MKAGRVREGGGRVLARAERNRTYHSHDAILVHQCIGGSFQPAFGVHSDAATVDQNIERLVAAVALSSGRNAVLVQIVEVKDDGPRGFELMSLEVTSLPGNLTENTSYVFERRIGPCLGPDGAKNIKPVFLEDFQ